MSKSIYVPMRNRWAAKSMILEQWLVEGGIVKLGKPVCRLNVDGARLEVKAANLTADDYGGIAYAYVREGDEIGPLGRILEFSTNAASGVSPREKLHSAGRASLRRRPSYPRIFLNYRHVDTEAYAWRLHESLTQRYGPDAVFLDQFSIRPGELYRWTLQQAVAHCVVMISLIGPNWFDAENKSGKPKLIDEGDLVHRELCAAMDRGAVVIPVLTPRGEIPASYSLPEGLVGLEELQYLNLSARQWSADLQFLFRALDEHVTQDSATSV
jgi:hypothetical protein